MHLFTRYSDICQNVTAPLLRVLQKQESCLAHKMLKINTDFCSAFIHPNYKLLFRVTIKQI